MTPVSPPAARTPHVPGLALLCLAGVIWGTIGVGVDLAHERSGLSVLTIGGYRAAIAIVVLLLLVRWRGKGEECLLLARRHPARVVVIGVLTAGFQVAFFLAVLACGVTVATFVCMGVAPVLLLVLGSWQQRRLPGLGQVGAVAAAVCGLALVSGAGGHGDGAHPLLGVLLALASGSAYAVSAHVGESLSHEYDGLSVAAGVMAVATAVLLPCGLVAGVVGHRLGTADGVSWLLLVYLGVVTMAVAFVLMFEGLQTTPSGTAVIATLLEPVTAALVAFVFLKESLTAAGLVGCLLVAAVIVSLGRRMERPEPQ